MTLYLVRYKKELKQKIKTSTDASEIKLNYLDKLDEQKLKDFSHEFNNELKKHNFNSLLMTISFEKSEDEDNLTFCANYVVDAKGTFSKKLTIESIVRVFKGKEQVKLMFSEGMFEDVSIERLSLSEEELLDFNKLYGIRELLPDGSYRKPKNIEKVDSFVRNHNYNKKELLETLEGYYVNAVSSNKEKFAFEQFGLNIPYYDNNNLEKIYIYDRNADKIISRLGNYKHLMSFVEDILPLSIEIHNKINKYKEKAWIDIDLFT